LFVNPYEAGQQRIQGAFISTENIEEMIQYIKDHNDKYFDEEAEKMIMADPQKEQAQQMEMDLGDGNKGGVDPQFIDALELCIKYDRVSTSFLQAKLSVGFPRASKIINWMEESGYIKIEGTKKTILATQADVDKLRGEGEE